MKQILIFISLILFTACGTVDFNESTVSNTDINSSSSTTDIAIEETNLSTVSRVKEYLNNESDYEFISVQNENEQSVENYINSGKDYNITPLVEKVTDPSAIEIYYSKNKSVSIPKDKLYIISNSDGTQILVTFDANNYNEIEEYSGLVLYHNTLKIPTGFTNIQLDTVTPESLKSQIDKAFSQIAINNPILDKNSSTISYKTALKNNDETIECSIDNEPSQTFVIDSNHTFNFTDDIKNISCNIGNNDKKTIFDINISDINTTTSTTNNEIPSENTFLNNSVLSSTKIKIQGRINNKISHEAAITVNIDNASIPIDELNVTAILSDTKNEYNKKVYESNSVYGGENRVFKFKDITVRLADERRFKLTYRVENIKTKEHTIIDTNLIVTIFGDYTDTSGNVTQNNDDKFTKVNIVTERDTDIFNTTLYSNMDIKINRNGVYDIICELYYNHGLTRFHSDTKTITVTGDNIHKVQFIIKNIEARDRPYTLKFTVTDKYSHDIVIIEGATFYVR